MAWNAPNDKKPDDKDPWTGKPKPSSGANQNDGPPMIDALLKSAYQKLKGRKLSFGKPSAPKFNFSRKLWALIALVGAILIWVVAGITHVTEDQQVVVFRLGVYQSTLSEGWYWLPVGIDRLRSFDRQKIYQENVMVDTITQDNNLAHLAVRIDYQVVNPQLYLLSSADSAALIRADFASAVVKVASQSTLDSLFADEKSTAFGDKVQTQLVSMLARHPLGVQIAEVEVTSIAVPEAVKEIFNKIDALYQEQGKQKQVAQDYEKQTLPPIQAKVNQLMIDARNYSHQATADAQQEVSAFLAVLPSYNKEPALTRYRLYTQTMTQVLSKTNKIIVDDKAPATTFMLPPSMTPSAQNSAQTSDASTTTSSYGVTSDNADAGNNTYGSASGGYSHD